MSRKKKTNKQQRPTKKTLGIEFLGVSPLVWKISGNGYNYSFRSRISYNGNKFYLGSFSTPEEAALAYNKKAKSLFKSERNAKRMNRWNNI